MDGGAARDSQTQSALRSNEICFLPFKMGLTSLPFSLCPHPGFPLCFTLPLLQPPSSTTPRVKSLSLFSDGYQKQKIQAKSFLPSQYILSSVHELTTLLLTTTSSRNTQR